MHCVIQFVIICQFKMGFIMFVTDLHPSFS